MRLICACLLSALVAASVSLGQAKNDLHAPRKLPGDGVSDPAGKVGFFPYTTGGIDALDLATGKLLWRIKDAAKPLFATDKRLFAQRNEKGKANQLRVVVFDTTQQGKRVLESAPIVLPDWVSVGTRLGRTFRGRARVDVDNVWLIWEARAFYAGGAAPTPEIEMAARKAASGVARIDLQSGKVAALDSKAAGKFFKLPAAKIDAKVGALTLTINDEPTKRPFQMKRTVRALNAAKQIVWQHEIAAPIFLPPPP